MKFFKDRIDFEMDVKNYIIDAIENNTNGTLIMFKLENYEDIKYKLGALYVEELIKQYESTIKSEGMLCNNTYKSRNIEYLILLKTNEHKVVEETILLINKLFGGIRKVKDKEIDCVINIGITAFPKDGIKSSSLLKNVEFAIYEARNNEGINYKYYEGFMIDKD